MTDVFKLIEENGLTLHGDIEHFAELVRQDEPVAWHEPGAYGNVTTHKGWALANGWEPLYTAPPQREWVRLTDEEVDQHWEENINTGCRLSFGMGVDYANRALKEKNA